MNILAVVSTNPYRLTLTGDSAPTTTTADYAISRVDGGALSIAPTKVWLRYGFTVEIALSDRLLDDVAYNISFQGGPNYTITYRSPLVPAFLPTTATSDDPEAEAFGVDVDWFADFLTGTGDIPTVRGRQCVVNDLAAIAITSPGEIFHRPDEGGGLIQSVNAPNLPIPLSEMTANVKRQWTRDPRIRSGGISITTDISTLGQVNVQGNVQTIAIDDPLVVKIPGGST